LFGGIGVFQTRLAVDAAARLGFVRAGGARVRLTGPIALEDEAHWMTGRTG
jgi:hypothetical protein